MDATNKWARPQQLTQIPLKVIGTLLPEWNEIPEDFKRERGEAVRWINIINDWFFSGAQNIQIICKPGISQKLIMAHLRVVLQDWDPSHEHKTSGAAWLLSLWTDKIEYSKVKVSNAT